MLNAEAQDIFKTIKKKFKYNALFVFVMKACSLKSNGTSIPATTALLQIVTSHHHQVIGP